MKRLTSLLCALALAGLIAVSGGADAYANSGYRLGSGDRIKVVVFGEDDLSGELEVDSSGTVAMPLIGTVPASGKTARQLELRVADMLKDGYLLNPRVSIEVLNYRPFYIIGEVQKPGEYPYRAGMTVINAVGIAGGFTFRADEDDITVSRGGSNATPRPAKRETIVSPGDVVRIKERFW